MSAKMSAYEGKLVVGPCGCIKTITLKAGAYIWRLNMYTSKSQIYESLSQVKYCHPYHVKECRIVEIPACLISFSCKFLIMNK